MIGDEAFALRFANIEWNNLMKKYIRSHKPRFQELSIKRRDIRIKSYALFKLGINSSGQCIRKLESMLETTESLFELCNSGKMTIATIDADGFYQWDLIDDASGGTSD